MATTSPFLHSIMGGSIPLPRLSCPLLAVIVALEKIPCYIYGETESSGLRRQREDSEVSPAEGTQVQYKVLQ